MKINRLLPALLLSLVLSGCSDDNFMSSDSDAIVTVRGVSAFGEWEREFVGLEAQADKFADEAAQVVNAIAENFEGSVDVYISIEDQLVESVSVEGNDEDYVPAAIMTAHDITALRLGLLPKGSLDELNVPSATPGLAPCTCVGTGCCCTNATKGGTCGNIAFECSNCKGIKGTQCAPGTQCWFKPEEEL